jgi:hypothetical protein
MLELESRKRERTQRHYWAFLLPPGFFLPLGLMKVRLNIGYDLGVGAIGRDSSITTTSSLLLSRSACLPMPSHGPSPKLLALIGYEPINALSLRLLAPYMPANISVKHSLILDYNI